MIIFGEAYSLISSVGISLKSGFSEPKQRIIMRTPQRVVSDAGKARRWHVFGVNEGMQSWHEVFDTIREMEEWLRRHPEYRVYSRWMSNL